MAEPFYLPVDPPLSVDAVDAVTDEQLITRSLFDPNYAGFDPQFNWRDYVTIQFASPSYQQEVEEAFTHMGQTEDGQHAIRQAHALWQIRRQDMKDPTSETLTITGHLADPRYENYGTAALPELGTIYIDEQGSRSIQLLGEDGTTHYQSTENIIRHEMSHLMDPLCVLPMYEMIHLARESRADLSQRNAIENALATTGKDIGLDLAWSTNPALNKGALAKAMDYAKEALPPEQYTALQRQQHAIEETQTAAVEYPAIRDTNNYSDLNLREFRRAMLHRIPDNDELADAAGAPKSVPNLTETSEIGRSR